MATNFSTWTKLSSQQSLNAHIQDKSNPHQTFTLEPQVDTRDVATKPSDYYGKKIGVLKYHGIKSTEILGLNKSAGGVCSCLIGLYNWIDSSGGKVHELAFNNDGIWHRNGAEDTWGNWNRLVEEPQLSNYLNVNNGGDIYKTISIKRINEYANAQFAISHTAQTGQLIFYDDIPNYENSYSILLLAGPKTTDNTWMLQLIRQTASGTENYAVLHTGNMGAHGYIKGEEIYNTYIPREQLNTGCFGFWNLANTPNLGFKQAAEGCLTIYGSQENGAYITLHKPGVFACHLGLGENTNDLCIGGWSMGENQYLIRHRGNEILTTSDPGAGSQLNTDYIMYVYE